MGTSRLIRTVDLQPGHRITVMGEGNRLRKVQVHKVTLPSPNGDRLTEAGDWKASYPHDSRVLVEHSRGHSWFLAGDHARVHNLDEIPVPAGSKTPLGLSQLPVSVRDAQDAASNPALQDHPAVQMGLSNAPDHLLRDLVRRHRGLSR